MGVSTDGTAFRNLLTLLECSSCRLIRRYGDDGCRVLHIKRSFVKHFAKSMHHVAGPFVKCTVQEVFVPIKGRLVLGNWCARVNGAIHNGLSGVS